MAYRGWGMAWRLLRQPGGTPRTLRVLVTLGYAVAADSGDSFDSEALRRVRGAYGNDPSRRASQPAVVAQKPRIHFGFSTHAGPCHWGDHCYFQRGLRSPAAPIAVLRSRPHHGHLRGKHSRHMVAFGRPELR